MPRFIQAGSKMLCTDAADSAVFSSNNKFIELAVGEIYTVKSDSSNGFVELDEVPGFLYTTSRFEKENKNV